jgi:hypothetical protein
MRGRKSKCEWKGVLSEDKKCCLMFQLCSQQVAESRHKLTIVALSFAKETQQRKGDSKEQ